MLQAMRIQMDVEKAKAGRRVGALLAAMMPQLVSPADTLPPAMAAGAEAGEAEVQASGRWQEVYYALILVERMAQHTPRQVCLHVADTLHLSRLAACWVGVRLQCTPASASKKNLCK